MNIIKWIEKDMKEVVKYEKIAWKEKDNEAISFYQGQYVGLLRVYNLIKNEKHN